MAKILDGKKLAKKINLKTKAKINKLKISPGLAAVLIGDNPASELYIKLKEKQAEKVGIKFYKHKFPKNTDQEKILKIIDLLNQDKKINGIIVQLPLPNRFNADKIIQAINPNKDVDGFHKKSLVQSPIILSVIEFLKIAKQNLSDEKIIIIANSKIFSNFLRAILIQNKAKKNNIFLIKPENKNLFKKTLSADIIIIAIGKVKFLRAEMVKKNAVIIDIGINKVNGKIVGDADFKNIKNKASFITPVPGGVGPLTIAMLLKNCLKLAKMQKNNICQY